MILKGDSMSLSNYISQIKEGIKRAHPTWYSLASDEQKKISHIAKQLPCTAESIAVLYVDKGRNIHAVIEVLERSGYVVNMEQINM